MYSISKLDLTFSFDLFLRSAVYDIKATHLSLVKEPHVKHLTGIIIYIYVTMFYIIF